MNIAISSDHRGLELLRIVQEEIEASGNIASRMGDLSGAPCDYPDHAQLVAESICKGEADRGVLICGTGIGMCITANKFPGVRAGLALDELSAQLSRSHNDSNVLCLSGDLVGHQLGRRIVATWIGTDFDGGRHARRIEKITAIDKQFERIATQDT